MALIGKLAKGAIKLTGSAALTAAGVAATVVRQAGYVSGIDILTDVAGAVQDASFEKIRDMWMSEDEKDDAYYDAQADRAVRRATSAASEAERFRKKYEKEKEKYNK